MSLPHGSSITLPENLKSIRDIVLRLGIHAENYLDLGCADGSLTLWFAKLIGANKIVGVDANNQALSKAKEKGIEYYLRDLNTHRLPFDNNYFDVVTAFEVIEHLWNKDFFLAEVYRVLKPGGIFILSTPNLASWINRILLALGYLPIHYDISLEYELQKRPFQRTCMHYGHLNLYTLPSLVNHLRFIGFEIIYVKGLLSGWCMKNKIVYIISKILSKRTTLAPILLVVARKTWLYR